MAFSILLSDRTIATARASAGLPGPFSDFQYPTLGSNHRYAPLLVLASYPHVPFSILLSDRTIATRQRHVNAISVDNFQYPTLGSNHRYL